VGTRFLHLIDESRNDAFSADPNDHRWVSIQIFYPAAPGGEERQPYLDRGVDEGLAGTGLAFLDIEKGYVLQFLRRYLKGLPAPLLDDPPSEYPEVRFQSRMAGL
jgi:hypothetical protein